MLMKLRALFAPRHQRQLRNPAPFAAELLEMRQLLTNYFVAPTGDDGNAGDINNPFVTIQHALDNATAAGDSVNVRAGTYHEKVRFKASGNKTGGYITLKAYSGEQVNLDGTGINGQNMILIRNKNYVNVIGLTILNNQNVTDGSGIRVLGYGTHIELRNNTIHDMRGENAMGITAYGRSTSRTISHLVIHGNHIFNSDPAPSEALTVNGNVVNFRITNNRVHDVNNIGIDVIGGERDINRNTKLVARHGVVRGNIVYRARSTYEDGFAAGIYVDGGRDIVIERNISYQNDLGIEIGAENKGITTRRIIVRNNIVHHNDKVGIVFGGFAKNRGRVRDSHFHNNTIYKNDTLNTGNGQIWIQYATNNTITNNIVQAGNNRILVNVTRGSIQNTFDYNLWFNNGGKNKGIYEWKGRRLRGFTKYRQVAHEDMHSLFAAPQFVDAILDDFHIKHSSKAYNRGTSQRGRYARIDFDRIRRPQRGKVDIGAYEWH